MVFILMGVMAVVFIGITLATIFLSFYKQGTLLEKKGVFFTLTTLIFIELLISFTALPSNFLMQRGVVLALLAMLIANIFIYFKSFKASRFILIFLAIATLLSVYIR